MQEKPQWLLKMKKYPPLRRSYSTESHKQPPREDTTKLWIYWLQNPFLIMSLVISRICFHPDQIVQAKARIRKLLWSIYNYAKWKSFLMFSLTVILEPQVSMQLSVCKMYIDTFHNWSSIELSITDSQNDVFLKFAVLEVSLPDNVSTWYITLCSVFFAPFLAELQKNIMKSGFRIP